MVDIGRTGAKTQGCASLEDEEWDVMHGRARALQAITFCVEN
jgi:hypothetical protein